MSLWLVIISTYLFFGSFFTAFFGAYVLSKGKTLIAKVIASLCILISIYLFGYLLELNSTTLPQMLFWNQIQYIGVPFYPMLWLLLSLVFNKTIKSISSKTLVYLFIFPVTVFVARLTNPFFHLYYSSTKLKFINGHAIMLLGKGPLYYFDSIFIIMCFVMSTALYIKNFHNSLSSRAMYRLIILASAFPYLGLALILIDPYHMGLDYGALFLPLSLITVAFFTIKYDFFQLHTLAKDNLFIKSLDAMIIINNVNIIMDYNPAAKSVFNNLNATSIGQDIRDILKNQKDFLEALQSTDKLDLMLPFNNESTFNHERRYFELKTVSIENNQGKKAGKLIELTDITGRKKAQESLRLLATTDSLTHLFNRSHFMTLAAYEIEKCSNNNYCFSFLLLDIDKFKKINDTWGHMAGDKALIHIANLMKDYFSDFGIPGRLGGEEFGILLPNTDLEKASTIAEEFRLKVADSSVKYEDADISFTVSIGLTSHSSLHCTFEDMLKIADAAMYESKAKGRNKVTIFKV